MISYGGIVIVSSSSINIGIVLGETDLKNELIVRVAAVVLVITVVVVLAVAVVLVAKVQ